MSSQILLHFSDNHLNTYCGRGVGDMVSARYTASDLDAVTCPRCLDCIAELGAIALYCVCPDLRAIYRPHDIQSCPQCRRPVCLRCYDQHRQDCPAPARSFY